MKTYRSSLLGDYFKILSLLEPSPRDTCSKLFNPFYLQYDRSFWIN